MCSEDSSARILFSPQRRQERKEENIVKYSKCQKTLRDPLRLCVADRRSGRTRFKSLFFSVESVNDSRTTADKGRQQKGTDRKAQALSVRLVLRVRVLRPSPCRPARAKHRQHTCNAPATRRCLQVHRTCAAEQIAPSARIVYNAGNACQHGKHPSVIGPKARVAHPREQTEMASARSSGGTPSRADSGSQCWKLG